MTKADASPVDTPGVGGSALRSAHFVTGGEGGVACWYSEGGIVPAAAKDDLLAFHRVISAFFRTGAVVPFRFPTTLADVAALTTWLQANAASVGRELERLSGMVQMELHITATKPSAAATGGREYLEARRDAQSALREAAATARQRVGELAADWRERETREGLRCYALVARGNEREFTQKVNGEAARGATIRVTGPWPPAEFLDPRLTTPS